MPAPVQMFSTRWCPYCIAARRLLDALGVPYDDTDVSDPRLRADMEARAGRHTVPQIWVGERHVGGYDDLAALHRSGRLLPLLEAAGVAPPA